jgi:hypothetical protein
MRKVLPYVATAILLGIATMIAPIMLLKPSYYELITSSGAKSQTAMLDALDGGEAAFEDRGALERAASPSNVSSAGLLILPSFLLAAVVSLYIRKRIK